VPVLEQKVERDRQAEGATRRLRVGLYTFDANEVAAAPSPVPRKTTRKRR
jgi:hypothetical protein